MLSGGCLLSRDEEGEQLSWSWREGEAFSCFAEVASVGPWPPGLAMDVAPARLPARPPAPPSTCRPA